MWELEILFIIFLFIYYFLFYRKLSPENVTVSDSPKFLLNKSDRKYKVMGRFR